MENVRKDQKNHNINWRDVQTKNVENNVDMSCFFFFFVITTLPQYWGLCVGADLERIYQNI